jgi:hypothetical protein
VTLGDLSLLIYWPFGYKDFSPIGDKDIEVVFSVNQDLSAYGWFFQSICAGKSGWPKIKRFFRMRQFPSTG